VKYAEIHDNHYTDTHLEIRWNDNKWGGLEPLQLIGEHMVRMRSIIGSHIVLRNCVISDSAIATRANSRLIRMDHCQLNNVRITGGPTAEPSSIVIADSKITQAADEPLLVIEVGATSAVALQRNTITNHSQQPIVALHPSERPTATTQVSLHENNVEQSSDVPMVAERARIDGHLKIVVSDNRSTARLTTPGLAAVTVAE